MDRRDFLKGVGAAALAAYLPDAAWALAGGRYDRLLVLVELKGGNDGLNTVVPYADAEYYNLRPRSRLPRDQVLQLDSRVRAAPVARAADGAVEGPRARGRAGRGLSRAPTSRISAPSRSGIPPRRATSTSPTAGSRAPSPPRRCRKSFAADGVVVGASDMGPLAGGGMRAIALANTEQFLRQAKLAGAGGAAAQSRARAHPEGRAGRHAGRREPQRRSRLPHRVSAGRLRQRGEDCRAGDRQQGGGGGGAAVAQRLRHPQQPGAGAGAAAEGACRRDRRAEGRARRARPLGLDAGDDLRRVRPPPAREPEPAAPITAPPTRISSRAGA